MWGVREFGLMAAGAFFSYQAAAQDIPRYNINLEHADDSSEEYERLAGDHTVRVRDSTRYEISFTDDTFVEDMRRRGFEVDFLVDHRDGSRVRISRDGQETKKLSGMFLRGTENSAACSLADRICMVESTRGHVVVERPDQVLASTEELRISMLEEESTPDTIVTQNTTNIITTNNVYDVAPEEGQQERAWQDWNITAAPLGELANGYLKQDYTDVFRSKGLGGRVAGRFRSERVNIGAGLSVWQRYAAVERCSCVHRDNGVAYRFEGDALVNVVEAFALGVSGERASFSDSLDSAVDGMQLLRGGVGMNTERFAAALGAGIMQVGVDEDNHRSATIGGRAAVYLTRGSVSLTATASYDMPLEKRGKRIRGSVSASLDRRVSPFARVDAGYTELGDVMRRYVGATIGVQLGGYDE